MAGNGRVIVGCSHGEEDPDAVAVAYLTAGAALDQGKDVVMWLTSDGVRLGLDGYAKQIRTDREPSGELLHSQFAEKGGRFYVCISRGHRQCTHVTRRRPTPHGAASEGASFAGSRAGTRSAVACGDTPGGRRRAGASAR